MSLKFEEEGHKYSNIDEDDDFQWVSVTTLVSQFKQPFDAFEMATTLEKKNKNKKTGKYAGMTRDEILMAWDDERKRSTDLGTWYHNQRESDMLQFSTVTRDGVVLPIIRPTFKNGIKYAPEQKIENGLYPEHFVYLRSAGVCGQADRVEVVDHRLDVYDYKTNKEIKTRGYQFWDGTRKMMTGPLRHLEDCELNHYALQLSVYMFIINKYNYNLVPGKIQIHHVEFEVEKLNEHGFPVYALNGLGEPIIKAVNRIDLPYLKKEVIMMFNWLKKNKQMVLHNGD